MMKYSQVCTRNAYYVSALHRLNPHEPEITKDILIKKVNTTYGNNLYNIYQGGKLNAALSIDGELWITVI